LRLRCFPAAAGFSALHKELDDIRLRRRDVVKALAEAAAEASLDSLPADEQENPEVTTLRNQLFFEGQVTGAAAATELEARLAADSDDTQALYQLALCKVVEQDYETAMELLLKLMQQDRSFGDDAGRRGLLKVFELLGDDPRVSRYRSRMASQLY
jgi:putative thioredoxin